MAREVIPVQAAEVTETSDPNPPVHPRVEMEIIREAVTVALNPEATEEEREAARAALAALQGGGGG
jgi:hypothetical protein